MIYELYPNHNRDTFFHLCNCVLILTDLSGGYNTKIVTKHIKKAFKNIGYCNAQRYKCPPNKQYKYQWSE